MELGSGHEVLMTSDTRDLAPINGVRHHLAVEVDRKGSVDRYQIGVAPDGGGVVHHTDVQKCHVLVGIEPSVERRGSERKGGDRDSGKYAFVGVGDLPRLMQLHQTCGEHFRVNAEATQWAGRQLGGDDIGDGPDASLESGAFGHERQGMVADGPVLATGWWLLEREWHAVSLNED